MRKVLLPVVAALTALLAVPALAADGTLSAASPTYKWSGGPMVGANGPDPAPPAGAARCSEVYQCDNEHIEVKDAGTLTIDVKAGSGSEDLDLRLYKSDAEGTAPGFPAGDPPATPVAEDARTEKDAKIVVRGLKPGFYVAQVASYRATGGTYDAVADLAVSAPSTAPAPGTTAPAPTTTQPTQTTPSSGDNQADEAKRKKKLAACNKKAKKIKNKKKRKAAQKKCAKKFGKKKA